MARETKKMTSVKLEFISFLKTVRVEAFDADDKRYLGSEKGANATKLYQGISTQIEAALPASEIMLRVDGQKIVLDQLDA